MATIQLNRQNFAKALSMCGQVAGKSNVIPVIACVHLTLKDNVLTIRATDLTTTYEVSFDVLSDTSTGVTFKTILEYVPIMTVVSKIADDVVSLIVKDETVTLTAAGKQYDFAVFGDESDFPETPPIDEVQSQSINFDVEANMKYVLSTACKFVSSEDLRQALKCVCFDIRKGDLSIVATDAHVMYVHDLKDIQLLEDNSYLIAASSLKKILPHLPNFFSVTLTKQRMLFNWTVGDMVVTVISQGVEENYPDYRAAIPQNGDMTIAVKEELSGALSRLAAMSVKDTYSPVKFHSDGTDLTLSCQSDRGRGEELIELHKEIAVDINFNPLMLGDAISTIPGNYLYMWFSGANKPVVIKNSELGHTLVLVMPVQMLS